MAKRNEKRLLSTFAKASAVLLSGKVDWLAVGQFCRCRRAAGPRALMAMDARFRGPALADPALRWSVITMMQNPRPQLEIMNDHPALAQLLIHARDGRLREQAVQLLNKPENDPLNLAALLCRCNDWVPSIRQAALERWREICRQPEIRALPAVLPAILERVPQWGRGGAEALEMLKQRLDWRRLLETMFLEEVDGPLARQLRLALRNPDMDAALGALATTARSAFVRAVATEALLTGHARWPEGREWEWIDKRFGLRKRRTVFGSREIVVPQETVNAALTKAARDRSALVRKLAADFLIASGPEDYGATVGDLTGDPARSVRDRMDYFERKWRGNGAAPEMSAT